MPLPKTSSAIALNADAVLIDSIITCFSVLNACGAWRFADEDVLGSKLEGAAWARSRWPDTDVIDAAVALRRGEHARLDEPAVAALLSAVTARLRH